jgi:putative ABC transport system permease protein
MYNYTTGGQRDIDLFPSAILAATGGYNDYVIYMAIDDVKEWNEWITGQPFDPETFVYDQITVFATNRETAGEVSEAIRKMGYGAGGMGDYLEQLNNFFVTMRLMLGAVGGVALLVAAFGVANTMMMAIMERTKEIGIMKAIGANNETILTLFLLEAGLVGFVGGLAGVLLSKVLQNLINTGIQNMPQGEGGINFLPIDPSQIGGNLIIIPQELIIFALLLATGVGIVAGLYPAWRAAKMPPVLALKQD